MTTFYPEVDASPNFSKIEEDIQTFWKEARVFERSVEGRPSQLADGTKNEFIFYDGPPFANGLPHYGHLLTGFVKDLFPRYQTMKGKRVERRFGWDCHGLPAEMGAEKALNISGRQQITRYGIEKFNLQCRTSVMTYAHDWEYYVTRQGRWVDFQNDYKTMDITFMESVMWAFKQLWDKGLLYEAHRVLPYSWAAETPLSNFETRLDNSYRDRQDPAVTVSFKLREAPTGAPKGCEGYYALAWTTTPWTLPSNLALAVGPDMRYRYIVHNGRCYITGAFAADGIAKHLYNITLHDSLKGIKPVVETERLILKPFEAKDYAHFQSLQADPAVAAITSDGVLTEEKIRAEFDRFVADHKKNGFSQWAVFEKETGAFVGRAGFDLRDFDQFVEEKGKQAELRYAFKGDFWGKGYAKELSRRLLDWAFNEQGFDFIIAGNSPSNARSIAVLDRFGFKHLKVVPYKAHNEVDVRILKRADYVRDDEFPGSALVGLGYEPLFPYFRDHPNSFRILSGDFIEEGSGTGIVHMAPGFGEDDQRVCEEQGIQIVCPVDHAGKFTGEVSDYAGLQVFEANKPIIQRLKEEGKLIRQDVIVHSYPHCWRTDTPLIYKAVPSWYVKVTAFRDRMVELNRQINWIPGHIKDGSFGKWLENARDWSISRNRFWGAPIPVWRSDNPASSKLYVFGSIAELEDFFGVKVEDLHRPGIDNLTKPDPENPQYTLRRVEDVLDCWFESGSMPYGQVHYPFEKKEWFENHFPADFIVEYHAQTRGWFYTLMVLSTALFDRPPFLNCICHGVVLDDKGQKLSKRLNNYPDPRDIFDTYGADAMRWLMMSANIMRGEELQLDKEGKAVKDTVRLVIKPLWSAYTFFCLYANSDRVEAEFRTDSPNRMDRYILAKTRVLVETIEQSLDTFDTPGASQAFDGFIEALNNWYIRRNRARFWKGERDDDKGAAYDTLYTVLVTVCKALAPLLPMTAEAIYLGLTAKGAFDADHSVHLADWPDVSAFPQEAELTERMDRAREICTAASNIRNATGIRTRQPLRQLTLIGAGLEGLDEEFRQLIADEVNVKEVAIESNVTAYATPKVMVLLPKVGARLGAKVKEVMAATKSGDWTRNADGTLTIAGVTLQPGEFQFLLEPKDAKNCQPLPSQDALVMLDITVTPELEHEGIARDLVRLVQQARKDANLNISDRIRLSIEGPTNVVTALQAHREFIAEQTLAVEAADGGAGGRAFTFTNEWDGETVVIGFDKAA